MHGTIFVLLKNYVTRNYDYATWHRLLDASGLSEMDFETRSVYPDKNLYDLIGQAAEHTGIPAEKLQEKFGEFLVPDLVFMYRRLVDPAWRTLDFLEYTEKRMHEAVRHDMPGSHPPVLHVERLSESVARVSYISKRRMGALAVGIIRGLAKHYGEEDELRISPVTQEDGDRVEILVEYTGESLRHRHPHSSAD